MKAWFLAAVCCWPRIAMAQLSFVPGPMGVKLSVVGTDHPVIIGSVDLPDGFGAVVSVLPAERLDSEMRVAAGQSACGDVPCFYPQDAAHEGYETVDIENGGFVTGMFSGVHGGPVRPDTYQATVTFILPKRLTSPRSGIPPDQIAAWQRSLNNVAFKTILHLGRTTPLPSQ